jgi:ABC-2 type transport system permease protein
MTKSFRRIFAMALRNLREILREPLGLVFLIGLPLLMEVLFYYVFHNMTAQFEMRYLAAGIVVFSQAFLTLFTGMLLSVDRATSFLTRLYVSPTRSYEFIFGYTLALLPLSLAQAVLFFVVGGIIDASFWSVTILLGILLSLVTALFFLGMGLLFGSVCNEKAIGGVSSIIITGQSILSGMWFPVEGLPQGMVILMRILPFKNATMLLQNAVNGYTSLWQDIFAPLLIVLAYTAAVFVAAILLFRRNMKRQ